MESILKKEIVLNKTLSRIFCILIFIILTTLGAFIRIPLPFSPVPITLQTFFVLLSGALLGANLGITAQLSYVCLGLSGLPIFTGTGSGALYLFGPTGGYLAGFVLASFVLGKTIKYSKSNLLSVFGLMCLADLVILGSGILWLKLFFGYNIMKLLFIGFLPFIPGDLLKALAASFVYLKLKTRLKEIL